MKLQELHVYGNQIKNIPKEIGKLVNLRELYMCTNQIKEIFYMKESLILDYIIRNNTTYYNTQNLKLHVNDQTVTPYGIS